MEIFMIITCIILGLAFPILLIRLLLLKNDIRIMSRKLSGISKTETNAQLNTATFEKNLVALTGSINEMLDKNRRDAIQVGQTEATLKRTIANISHDLRTPLTAAKGYLQMAKDPTLDEESRIRYLSIIEGRLEDLTTLMDSLFTFSKAVEGNLKVEKVNVSHLLSEVLVAEYALIQKKGFQVESQLPDRDVFWAWDENALTRVLQNLIANAVIHGKNILRVKLTDEKIEIANEVDDLDSIDTQSIFDRFYTADTSRTQKRTGLGLAIAGELVHKMGGEIVAKKEDGLLKIIVTLAR